MSTLIETQGISKHYRRMNAVHDLDLAVDEGSICAFLGRNGAGKSTTIRMIAGLLDSCAGQARLLGHDSSRLPSQVWEQVGYVADGQELYDYMHVDALIDFTSKLYPNWDKVFEQELVKIMNIKTDRKVKHCSKGERAKVCLLLAMAFRPKLLLLDEPFNGLDPLVKDEFLSALLEITEQNEWSIFFSSHDIDEVEKMADRVVIIDKGRKTEDDEVANLQNRFRQIDVMNFDGGLHISAFESALHLKRDDRHVQFVCQHYSDQLLSEWKQKFPQAEFEVKELSLKEIFVSLAKVYQEDD